MKKLERTGMEKRTLIDIKSAGCDKVQYGYGGFFPSKATCMQETEGKIVGWLGWCRGSVFDLEDHSSQSPCMYKYMINYTYASEMYNGRKRLDWGNTEMERRGTFKRLPLMAF